MNIAQLEFLRTNTVKLVNDKPLLNHLDKLDNYTLIQIGEHTEDRELKVYIDWLVNYRKL